MPTETEEIQHQDRLDLARLRRNLHVRASAWKALGMPLRDMVRAGATSKQYEALFAASPSLRWTYDKWVHSLQLEVPPEGTLRTRRERQYARKAAAMKSIPPYDRDLPEERLRAKYPHAAETLRDADWRLKSLRGHKPLQVGMLPWQDETRIPKLRVWVCKLQRACADARIAGAETAPVLEIDLERCTDKLKAAELEEYDLKVRAWRATMTPEDLRARPRIRTAAERRAHQGRPRGRPPNTEGRYDEHRVPKRPHRPRWLIEEERQETNERKETQRIALAALAGARYDAQERKYGKEGLYWEIRHSRTNARGEERKRVAFEKRILELLDWVWGEARIMHIGMLVDGDMYIDADRILYSAKRQDVLEACAVRVSTGWVFPSATGNGRVR